MLAEAVSAGFYEHKAIQELTHCTAGTYIQIHFTSAATAAGYTIHIGYTPGHHRGATG
jgi:hypothetical protein